MARATNFGIFEFRGTPFPKGASSPEALAGVEDFTVRDSDVFVSSYPKSGSTWLLEIAWRILAASGANFDIGAPLDERAPYLEFIYPKTGTPAFEVLAGMDSPRVIKTHLPYYLLPKHAREGCGRVLYIMRNPKDVAVSFFFHYRATDVLGAKLDFPTFVDLFLKGQVHFGGWAEHVNGYWKSQGAPNLSLLSYEEMKGDLLKQVRIISDSLNAKLTVETIQDIARSCTFASMKSSPLSHWSTLNIWDNSVSPFFRKGKVGDWVAHFDDITNRTFDDQIYPKIDPELRNLVWDPFCM